MILREGDIVKAFVYIGGGIDPAGLDEYPAKGDLCIAADSGWRNARRLGVRVDLLVGDMDSLGTEASSAMAEVKAMGGEVMQVPAEKDETDTQLAVHEAVRRGADEIVIVGGLLSGLTVFLASCVGFVLKTFGIDFVIGQIKKAQKC